MPPDLFLEQIALADDVGALLNQYVPSSYEYIFIKLLLLSQSDVVTKEESSFIDTLNSKFPGHQCDAFQLKHDIRLLFQTEDMNIRTRLINNIARTLNVESVLSTAHNESDESYTSHLDNDKLQPQTLVDSLIRSGSFSSLSSDSFSLINPDSLTDLSLNATLQLLTAVPCFIVHHHLLPTLVSYLKKAGASAYDKLNLSTKLSQDQLLHLLSSVPSCCSLSFIRDLTYTFLPHDLFNVSLDDVSAYYTNAFNVIKQIKVKDLSSFIYYFSLHKLSFDIQLGFIDFEDLSFFLTLEKSKAILDVIPPELVPEHVFSHDDLVFWGLVEYFKSHSDGDFSKFQQFLPVSLLQEALLMSQLIIKSDTVQSTIDLINDDQVVERVYNRKVSNILNLNQFKSFSDAPVSICVSLKNVENASLKIFEIDSKRFYRQNTQLLSHQINLDGFEPNHVIDLPSVSPSEFLSKVIDLPNSTKRGSWVVDLICDDHCTRSVISKGYISVFEEETVAGHHFHLFDESGEKILNFDGYLFVGAADGTEISTTDGEIVVPHLPNDKRSKRERIVFSIKNDGFTVPHTFTRNCESYSLRLSPLIVPEQFKSGKSMNLPIKLILSGQQIDFPTDILRKSVFTVTILQTENRSMVKYYDNIEISSNNTVLLPIDLPHSVTSITISLTTKISSKIRSGFVFDLSDSHVIDFPQTQYLSQPFLSFNSSSPEYSVILLGRNGERFPSTTLDLEVNCVVTNKSLNFRLITDHEGLACLGPLIGVSDIKLSSPTNDFGSKSFNLSNQNQSLLTNQTFSIPTGYSHTIPLEHSDFVLVHSAFHFKSRSNLSNLIEQSDRKVTMKELPAGVYQLHCLGKGLIQDKVISFVISGKLDTTHSFLIDPSRIIDYLPFGPLIESSSFDPESHCLSVELSEPSESFSHSLFQTTFCHSLDLGFFWSRNSPLISSTPCLSPSLAPLDKPLSLESRYVAHRQSQPHSTGTLADFPSLLVFDRDQVDLVPQPLNQRRSDRHHARDLIEPRSVSHFIATNMPAPSFFTISIDNVPRTSSVEVCDFLESDVVMMSDIQSAGDVIELDLEGNKTVCVVIVFNGVLNVITIGEGPSTMPTVDLRISDSVVIPNQSSQSLQQGGSVSTKIRLS
ncbi:hypothetical protein GEMRC1_004421 [Eukaryota sp. GEM-RC1]